MNTNGNHIIKPFELILILCPDYNFGNIIFAFSFLASELPSQLITKRLGPDRWIPVQVTLWSVAAAAQSGITGRKSFLALRCILGMLEVCFTLIVYICSSDANVDRAALLLK